MQRIFIFLAMFLMQCVCMAYAEKDPMIGKTYRITALSGGGSESAMGEVVERGGDYIKIRVGEDVKSFKMNQVSRLEEVPAMKASQQERLNKVVVGGIEESINKSIESLKKNCPDFADKINKCEPYECAYLAPGGAKTINQKILGFENSRCHFLQEVAGLFKLDCRLSQSTLDAIRKQRKVIADAEQAGKKMRVGFSTSTKEQSSSYVTIDGKTHEDPFQVAINKGECVTSPAH